MKRKIVNFLLVVVFAWSLFVRTEAVWAATPILGDVDSNYRIDLIDASAILRAALGIERLTDDMDVNRDGYLDLLDARKVLRVALGIDPLEDSILMNMDYIVEKSVAIELEMDQEYYVSGDSIQMSVSVQNQSDKSIPFVGLTDSYGSGSCVKVSLVDASDQLLCEDCTLEYETECLYFGAIEPSEEIVTNRKIDIPETVCEERIGQEKCYIKVDFMYRQEDTIDNYNIKIRTEKFPVLIGEPLDVGAIIASDVAVELDCVDKQYQCGETMEFSIRATNHGNFVIPIAAGTSSYGSSYCLDGRLVDKDGTIYAYVEGGMGNAAMYYGELLPEGEIERECQMFIPEQLDCSSGKEYYIEVKLSYEEKMGGYSFLNCYYVKFPINIISSKAS